MRNNRLRGADLAWANFREPKDKTEGSSSMYKKPKKFRKILKNCGWEERWIIVLQIAEEVILL